MLSTLLSIDTSIRTFFNQLTETLGFIGYLGILVGVELLFVIIFGIRASLSYESRLKRSLDKANEWLFRHKVVDSKNIKAFNEVMKEGQKRLAYYWQQYILYREGSPSTYMSIENVVEKPIKTSTWQGSIRSLGIVTAVWTVVSLIFGLASQATNTWSFQYVAVALVLPFAVVLVGAIAIMIMRGVKHINLDDIYHIYHIFARFVDNACAELPTYIDFDLLFTAKEIENGNPQLREYYEARARKAKEEFENAKKNDFKFSEYDFKDVGVDGRLLLDRAMKESEAYINKRTATLTKIAQAQSQKEALRRNYENVQMDLQRKIQASKENIQKLIEQQAATTSRIEVGLLRQQQEKEAKKQEALQKDYDTEETRFKSAKADIDAEIEKFSKVLSESVTEVETAMSNEYQTFFEKVMKSAYAVAEKKSDDDKKELVRLRETSEKELINVQTQIKRLMDENLTLREKLEQFNPDYKQENQDAPEGHYDSDGNFIYADGSYHSPDGLFHDIDGKIYDMNGVEVTHEVVEQGATKEQLIHAQIAQFGSFVSNDETETEKVQPQIQNEIIEENIEEDDTEETVQTLVEEGQVQEEKQPVPEETETEKLPEDSFEEEVEENDEELVEEEVEEDEITTDAPRRRGRPRKIVSEEPKVDQPKKSRGRPKKVVDGESKPVITSSTGKRGRPKGSVKKPQPEVTQEARKRGRPRKSPILGEDIDSLSQISQLITEEEIKLNKMKALLNSEIDEVMKAEEREQVDKEREELIQAVEALKAQAAGVDKTSQTNKDLATINQRLEDLIKEISTLNNKK